MTLTPSTEQKDKDKHAGASFRPAQSNCTQTDLDFAKKNVNFTRIVQVLSGFLCSASKKKEQSCWLVCKLAKAVG